MQHRADLDGLRAVAVGLVVLAHAHVPGFAGGWVGVDVFFVLSGYLITRILLLDMAKAGFSYHRFLARRFRRLAPAFVCVGLVSLGFFSLTMPGFIFHPAATTLAWSFLGMGNFEQARETDYFADDGALNPYTHLWSLGVEEQFYVVFPLLIWVIWRHRHRTWFLAALAAASLGWLLYTKDATATYFWPWTRAWGLLMGVVFASWQHHNNGKRLGGWTAWAGMALILGACWFGNDEGRDWYMFAVAASVGALGIIAAGPSLCARALSWWPMLWVGTASYSIYLVHQPILVAFHLNTGGYALGGGTTTLAVAACIAVGLLVRRWVEQPFLHGDAGTRLGVWKPVAVQIAIAGLAWTLSFGQGEYARAQIASLWGGGNDVTARLVINRGNRENFCDEKEKSCLDVESDVYLWGDSHAMHMYNALVAAGITPRQWAKAVCAPSGGVAFFDEQGKWNKAWAQDCALMNTTLIDHLKKQPPGVLVMVSAGWFGDRAADNAWDAQKQQVVPLKGGDSNVHMALEGVISAFKGTGWRLVTVSPNLRWAENPGRCNAIMAWNNLPMERCNFHLDDPNAGINRARHKATEAILQSYADKGETHHLSTVSFLCPNGVCTAAKGDTIVWRDIGHLSNEGSTWLGQQTEFQEALYEALGMRP
jgi:peptidoglycan/LPS O-acetylase OafA/YrhL